MKNDDMKKAEQYERNRYIVTAKKDMFGNWYLVDANGNKAQTLNNKGELTVAKHKSKNEPVPKISVSAIDGRWRTDQDVYIPITTFMAKIGKEFAPNIIDTLTINSATIPNFHPEGYTVDMYETLYRRAKILSDIEATSKVCELKAAREKVVNGKESGIEGLKMFCSYLQAIKTRLAFYFSISEHKYLKEILKKEMAEAIPASSRQRLLKHMNVDKYIDNYLQEVAQIRENALSNENESVRYIASLADPVANNQGPYLSFGAILVDKVDKREKTAQDQHTK